MTRFDSLAVGLGLLLSLLLTPGAKAAQPAETGEPRQLAIERQQIDARFEREQAECRQRFALNACVDDARARQRQALAALRNRQRVLDEQQRQQRATERQSAIERKQQAQRARPLEAGSTPSAAAAASAAPPASRPSSRTRQASDSAQAQAKAAERAAAARKLQAAIQADQERIKARQAQRAAQGKKADPLPPPASSPG